MKRVFGALTLLGVHSVSASVQAASSHPIENVIALLKGLSSKAEEEGKTEALSYQKFEKWCADNTKTLSKAIAGEEAAISQLQSDVSSKKQLIKTLERELAELEANLGDFAKADAAADEERSTANALYEQAKEDLTNTAAAVTSALAQLEATPAASLLQVAGNPKIREVLALLEAMQPDGEQRTKLAALLQGSSRDRPDLLAGGDSGSHVQKYAFKSDNIIELLKELKASFEDQLLTATKEETNSVNAYTVAKQARAAATAAAGSSKDDKTKALADAKAALAEYESTLASTQSDLEADTDSLNSVKRQCAAKKQEWEERSSVREGEIKAIAAAVQILSKATGVRTEAPSNPEAPTSPLSFLQVAAEVDPKTKALNLLLAAAHKAKSSVFARMAQEISLSIRDGPFDKVNAQIQKMIFRLMTEQKDEDTHKLWCDQELSKSNASKINKEERIEELNLKIEAGDATVQLLTQEIGEAQDMVAQLTAFVAEATDIRQIGKQENAAAIKDAQDAQSAIANAVSVLDAFYKSSGAISESSLLQREPVSLPESPDTWAAEYTGVSDPANQPSGIITVLQATGAEFAKMEADTKAQEVLDQKAFEQAVKDANIEKARREAEIEAKSQQKTRLLDKLGALRKTHKEVSNELEAVEQYLRDLVPACIAGDSTYEERKDARTAEIEALRQAQVILRDAFKEQEPAEEELAAIKSSVKSKSFLQVNRKSGLA